MFPIPLPAFGESTYYTERVNAASHIYVVEDTSARLFRAYADRLLSDGFVCREEQIRAQNRYAAYEKDDFGVFLTYFGALREFRMVCEEGCHYFRYQDPDLPKKYSPQITQLHLEDFGMSYVIRLSDGRFVILDGGCGFEPDLERLRGHLTTHAPNGHPIIAAWILSHPHSDHYLAFNFFMERYGEEVELKKVLLNFPDHHDTARYPKLDHRDSRFSYSTSGTDNIPRMYDNIRRSGAQTFMLHTGQTYRVGDATFEILACIEDTVHLSQNINAISAILRMTLGGQVTLWCTDGSMSLTRLPARYGDYLKSDILQIPHHGFQCGTAEAEIEAYDLIRPSVCLLPVSEYNAFTRFCTFRDGTRHIMRHATVEELITGDESRTLTLPYHAPARAKAALEERFCHGLANNGARTWIFTGLDTAKEEDFLFTLLNTTNFDATVWIELYFDNRKQTVQDIRAIIPAMAVKRLCIVGDEVDTAAAYFDWMSLAKHPIPENAPFAVRFLSDRPIVITHPDHTAAYHTND